MRIGGSCCKRLCGGLICRAYRHLLSVCTFGNLCTDPLMRQDSLTPDRTTKMRLSFGDCESAEARTRTRRAMAWGQKPRTLALHAMDDRRKRGSPGEHPCQTNPRTEVLPASRHAGRTPRRVNLRCRAIEKNPAYAPTSFALPHRSISRGRLIPAAKALRPRRVATKRETVRIPGIFPRCRIRTCSTEAYCGGQARSIRVFSSAA